MRLIMFIRETHRNIFGNKKTIACSGTPIKINIDKSGAKAAGIKDFNKKNKF